MITTVELLTEQECQEIRAGIDDLKHLWIQRHLTVPFYTLGASNYFDIATKFPTPYYQMATEYNPILQAHFGKLYQRLADALADRLQAPVGYRNRLALPGFHIFLADPAFGQMLGLTHRQWYHALDKPEIVASPIHCDTPHTIVDWGTKEGLDFNNPISFTLAIALPKCGAGMHVWDLWLKETTDLSEAKLEERINSSPKQLYSYEVGKLALHSGQMYHQVASMPNMQIDDERITLQGHGLMCDGTWQLYW